MTAATATFYGVSCYDGRRPNLGVARRAFGGLLSFLVFGVGGVAVLGVLTLSVVLGALWAVTVSHPSPVAGISKTEIGMMRGPRMLALTSDDPRFNVAGAPRGSFGGATADADLPLGARLARARALAVALMAELPQRSVIVASAKPDMPVPLHIPLPVPSPRPRVENPLAERLADVTGSLPAEQGVSLPPEVFSPVAAYAPVAIQPAEAKQPLASAGVKLAHNSGPPLSVNPALPARDSRTAIYDISAGTVYMPNGDRLEAHSGLGEKMDDPKFVHVRMRGPTPPNVYTLTMRERLFHGVRAIRLNPVDDNKMFGRDGMLAHSYMLGPNGQSNGCVSFKNYDKFLQAFLDGEVDRMIVVTHMDGMPPSRFARSGGGSSRASSRPGDDDRYANIGDTTLTW